MQSAFYMKKGVIIAHSLNDEKYSMNIFIIIGVLLPTASNAALKIGTTLRLCSSVVIWFATALLFLAKEYNNCL